MTWPRLFWNAVGAIAGLYGFTFLKEFIVWQAQDWVNIVLVAWWMLGIILPYMVWKEPKDKEDKKLFILFILAGMGPLQLVSVGIIIAGFFILIISTVLNIYGRVNKYLYI